MCGGFMAKRMCKVCGYIYDESKEKVKYKKLPYDWKCPVCGAPKVKVEEMHILPKMFAMFAIFFILCYLMYTYFQNQKPAEYDIYVTDNEISTMYANMIAINKDNDSFIWFKDTHLINDEELRRNKRFYLSEYLTQDSIDAVVNEINTKINEHIKGNSKNYIHLYLSDDLAWVEFKTVNLYNVDYDITYITSGGNSYRTTYAYSTNNTYDKYKEYKNTLDNILKNNITDDNLIKDNSLLLVGAMRDNADYIIEHPEYIVSSDALVNVEYKNIHFNEETLSEAFNGLDTIEQSRFLKLVGFDKSALDSEYFKDAEKAYLVIVGTDSIATTYTVDEFKARLDNIIADYNTNYHILYLPVGTIDSSYANMLDQLGIMVLPESTSLKLLSMVYPKISYSGFINDDFVELNKKNVTFLFGMTSEGYSYPLNQEFENVNFIK
jgi:rubredoxin